MLISDNRLRAEAIYARRMEEAGFELLCTLESRPGHPRWSALLAHNAPDCFLLDATEQAIALEVLREFQSMSSLTPIITFADTLTSEAALPLLMAGAIEFFDLQTSRDELAAIRSRLGRHRATQPAQTETPSVTARVAGFTSAKPGAGASTLARHAASALKRLTHQRVLLMDLNPERVLYPNPREEWNGVTINPQPAELLPLSLVRTQILDASNEFDWIILDLPCAASEFTLSLAPKLANIVVTATPDLASIHIAQRSLKLLEEAGAPPSNIRLALNRVNSQGPLTAKDWELVLKHRVEWQVPDEYRRLQSTSEWGLTEDVPVAKAICAIAAGLVNGLRTAPEPAQLFWMSRCDEVLA